MFESLFEELSSSEVRWVQEFSDEGVQPVYSSGHPYRGIDQPPQPKEERPSMWDLVREPVLKGLKVLACLALVGLGALMHWVCVQ